MSTYFGIAEAARDLALTRASKKKEDFLTQEMVGEIGKDIVDSCSADSQIRYGYRQRTQR